MKGGKIKLIKARAISYDMDGRVEIEIEGHEKFFELYDEVAIRDEKMPTEFGERFLIRRPFGSYGSSTTIALLFDTEFWKDGKKRFIMDTLKAFSTIGNIKTFLRESLPTVMREKNLKKGIEFVAVEEVER